MRQEIDKEPIIGPLSGAASPLSTEVLVHVTSGPTKRSMIFEDRYSGYEEPGERHVRLALTPEGWIVRDVVTVKSTGVYIGRKGHIGSDIASTT